MKPYIDPTNGQWVGERETRSADGEVSRETEWFDTEAEARQFSRTPAATPPPGWFDVHTPTGVLHLSEQYAALRMSQLGVVDQSTEVVLGETVHDALMAAYQAGVLAATEGLSVQDAIGRLA